MKHIYTSIFLFLLFIPMEIYAQNISTLYGTTDGYSGDGGQASNAQLSGPANLEFDDSGNLYIADSSNDIIRKIDISGIITTIAGTGTEGYSGDGGLAISAELNNPYGITVAPNGNLFFTELSNHVIRKIDNSGIITTVAGTGTAGYSGDGALATSAQLDVPFGITFDSDGNLFFADRGNNVFRKIDISGIITTIAGTGTPDYSGDGGLATSATLNQPYGITFNSVGEAYITDASNHVIRKIDNAGIITTVAGNGTSGYSGNGGVATSAQLKFPRHLIFDGNNNYYFSESGNHTVRKVDNSGIITTIAGSGTAGYSGDGVPANDSQLNTPWGITFDPNGHLLISDSGNDVIRQVTNVALNVHDLDINESKIILHPNPSNNMIQISGLTKTEKYCIYNTLGTEVNKGIVYANKQIDIQNLTNGLYFLKFESGNTIKFIKE